MTMNWIWRASLKVCLVLCVILGACSPSTETSPAEPSNQAVSYAGKKILWVSSYHKGYSGEDLTEAGLREVLVDSAVEFEHIQMDTNRNPGAEYGEQTALEILAQIKELDPDVIIASDDATHKYLVSPHLKDTEYPIVFCGINADLETYGYPAPNVTGLLERFLVPNLVAHASPHAAGTTVGLLTGDTITGQTVGNWFNERYFDGQMQKRFVSTSEQFRTEFLAMQDEVDLLIIFNNQGISDWDEAVMEQFILEHATIPTIGFLEWMAPYNLMTLTIVPQEFGRWTAETALDILAGASPTDIPIAQNQEGNLILNFKLASQLDVVFAPDLLRNATAYGLE